MIDLKPEHLTARKLRSMAKDSDSATLLKLKERLMAIIDEKQESERKQQEEDQRRNEAVKEIMSLVQEQGLTLEDLVASQGGASNKKGKKPRKRQPIASNDVDAGTEEIDQNESAH